MQLNEIEQSLLGAGLAPRGAFHPCGSDEVPQLAKDVPARTVVLAGNAGPQMWQAFDAARSKRAATLDEWSLRVLTEIATRLRARGISVPASLSALSTLGRARRSLPRVAARVADPHGLWLVAWLSWRAVI